MPEILSQAPHTFPELFEVKGSPGSMVAEEEFSMLPEKKIKVFLGQPLEVSLK